MFWLRFLDQLNFTGISQKNTYLPVITTQLVVLVLKETASLSPNTYYPIKMTGGRSFLIQAFPPKPNFTDKNLPDLHGKVSVLVRLIARSDKSLSCYITMLNYAPLGLSRNWRKHWCRQGDHTDSLLEKRQSLPRSTI